MENQDIPTPTYYHTLISLIFPLLLKGGEEVESQSIQNISVKALVYQEKA